MCTEHVNVNKYDNLTAMFSHVLYILLIQMHITEIKQLKSSQLCQWICCSMNIFFGPLSNFTDSLGDTCIK